MNNVMLQVYDVTITIFVNDIPVKCFQMTAPRVMIEDQFIAFVNEAARMRDRVRVLMERYEVIWDRFEQKQKTVPYKLEFANYETVD